MKTLAQVGGGFFCMSILLDIIYLTFSYVHDNEVFVKRQMLKSS